MHAFLNVKLPADDLKNIETRRSTTGLYKCAFRRVTC